MNAYLAYLRAVGLVPSEPYTPPVAVDPMARGSAHQARPHIGAPVAPASGSMGLDFAHLLEHQLGHPVATRPNVNPLAGLFGGGQASPSVVIQRSPGLYQIDQTKGRR